MGKQVAGALALALLTSLTSGNAHAGYYMEHEAVLPNPQTLQPVRATIRSWHEGNRFKRQSPMKNEYIVIDLDKKEVMGINEDARTYWKISSDRYRGLAMMSLMVMGVQPTQDGGIVVPDGLFKKTGTTGEVAGRKAYEVKINGALPPGVSTTFWLSKEIPLPISSMVNQLKMTLGDPKHAGFQRLYDQWNALEGYPVQSVTTINTPRGRVVTSETLLVYRDEKVPLSQFQVPKGYSLTTDPITLAEQAAMQQMGKAPAGIGAPLGAPAKR
jgi:hypothetical protein